MAGKDRKKELARQRYERQRQREAARQAKARRVRVIGASAAVVVIALGGTGVAVAMSSSKDKKNTPVTPPSTNPATNAAAKPGECAYPDPPAEGSQGAKDVGKPPAKPLKGDYKMTIDTNLGPITTKLDGTKAGCTVNSFNYLASKKFFNGSPCHRLTSGGLKVLQCGDPTGTGSGGPKYGFANENVPPKDASGQATYKRGVIAMAHSQLPNSNGSQFFIVYGDSPLPADYTIFGEITGGLNIVDDVAKAGSTPAGDGKPKKKIDIKTLTVAKM